MKGNVVSFDRLDPVHAYTPVCTHACVPLMKVTWHRAQQPVELGLSCKDSAAGIKRTLTVVPNAVLDLHTLVPGCTFRGRNTFTLITSIVNHDVFLSY